MNGLFSYVALCCSSSWGVWFAKRHVFCLNLYTNGINGGCVHFQSGLSPGPGRWSMTRCFRNLIRQTLNCHHWLIFRLAPSVDEQWQLENLYKHTYSLVRLNVSQKGCTPTIPRWVIKHPEVYTVSVSPSLNPVFLPHTRQDLRRGIDRAISCQR